MKSSVCWKGLSSVVMIGLFALSGCSGGTSSNSSSEVDAVTLEGHPASDFSLVDHGHSGYALESHSHLQSDIIGPLDAQTLGGLAYTSYSLRSHGHDEIGDHAAQIADQAAVLGSIQVSLSAKKKGYYAIAGPSFSIEQSGWGGIVCDTGGRITNVNASSMTALYYGLNLPHGAAITRFVWYYTNSSNTGSERAVVELERVSNIGVPGSLTGALLSSPSPASGANSVTSSGLANATIDNRNFSYFLSMQMPQGHVTFNRAMIEYEYSTLSTD